MDKDDANVPMMSANILEAPEADNLRPPGFKLASFQIGLRQFDPCFTAL